MRIDSMNVPSYQVVQPQSQKNGTESKAVDKPKVKNSITENSTVLNNETQVVVEEKERNRETEVIKAIEKANTHIRTYDRRLEFSIHDTTKQIMVKVINTSDDSIIREIPSEKVLDMVAHMWEVAGILVDKKI